MTTNAVAEYIHLTHKMNELNADYGYAQIAAGDDPRIEASRKANKSLIALTDAEIDEVNRITGWGIG